LGPVPSPLFYFLSKIKHPVGVFYFFGPLVLAGGSSRTNHESASPRMELRRIAFAVASGAAAAVEAATIAQRAPPGNILTLHNVNFDEMLERDEYDAWFRTHLRCSQASFRAICTILRHVLHDYNVDSYNKLHGFEKKVAMLLHFLAFGKGYRGTGLALGVSGSWSSEVISLLCKEIRKARKQFIRLPETTAEWREVEAGFQEKRGFPGVVGAVDGSLFPINRPADYEGFYCRKFYPALNMQAVVDHRCMFMSIDIRPGSWSDQKIWNASRLGRTLNRTIPPGTHMIADAGYAIRPWLITPYPETFDGAYRDNETRRYNFIHSSTRMVVERAFGMAKERFRVLKSCIDVEDVVKAVDIIVSALVMHNILIAVGDDEISFDLPIVVEDESDDEDDEECFSQVIRQIAINKRDDIARNLV